MVFWAGHTERWDKQSGDWLSGVRGGKQASVVEGGVFMNRLMMGVMIYDEDEVI